MSPVAVPTNTPASGRRSIEWGAPDSIRCECRRCGVHAFHAIVSANASPCVTCGSTEFVQVAVIGSAAADSAAGLWVVPDAAAA